MFISMQSILGWASFCMNYCINVAWHGGNQPVALLRCNGSPGYFDSGLQVICIVGSSVSHLPLEAAEKIVGVSLPSLQDIYSTRLTRKALSIAGDPTHPTHSFFSLLPSGRRLRSLQANQQTEGQLCPSGCQEAELPPVLAPPPLFYPTQH